MTAAVVVYGSRYNLIKATWLQILRVAGAALAYGVAAPLGGSGFIAAFVAGMTSRPPPSREERRADVSQR